MSGTISITATWHSSAELNVPDDMTREEAVAAFISGNFHLFDDDFNSSNAELIDWDAL